MRRCNNILCTVMTYRTVTESASSLSLTQASLSALNVANISSDTFAFLAYFRRRSSVDIRRPWRVSSSRAGWENDDEQREKRAAHSGKQSRDTREEERGCSGATVNEERSRLHFLFLADMSARCAAPHGHGVKPLEMLQPWRCRGNHQWTVRHVRKHHVTPQTRLSRAVSTNHSDRLYAVLQVSV